MFWVLLLMILFQIVFSCGGLLVRALDDNDVGAFAFGWTITMIWNGILLVIICFGINWNAQGL